jgi:hypothetical protein
LAIDGGVILEGISKLQAEYMERLWESPLTIYTNPFLKAGWRQVAHDLREQERRCQQPELQERIRGARIMASKMPPGASPWDAMKAMWEIEETIHDKCIDGLARRFMREACYKVLMKEFIGRDVG